MIIPEGFWKVWGPKSLLIYLKLWVLKSYWGHKLIYNIVGHNSAMLYDIFYCWLYLILVDLSVLFKNTKYLKSRVSVNMQKVATPYTGFRVLGLIHLTWNTVHCLLVQRDGISLFFIAKCHFLAPLLTESAKLFRCRAVRLSICLATFFSNRIGSPRFHQIFPIFCLNMHNNIAQKFMVVEFFFFFNGSLIRKKIDKNGNFRGFWPISQKVFNMRPWHLVYRHIVGTFMCMWKTTSVGQIVRPFLVPHGAKIGQYIGFHLFFLKCFHWIHT